jgi:hypothetical protein
VELPPPPHPLMLPVLATATYLAALIAVWGFTSLALDTDVVSDPDASRLVGPSMAAAAAIVEFLALRSLAGRASPWWTAVATSAASYGALLLAAAITRSLDAADLLAGLVFAGTYAASPFAILPAILAGLVVVATWAALRAKGI